MTELFESTRIAGMTLPNRFVRSATWEGLATPEGFATDALADLLARLAEGQVGLIITGHAYVSPEGQAAPAQLAVHPGQAAIHTDAHVPPFEKLTRKVHDAGGRVCLQVSHGGRYALKLPGLTRLGPSTIEGKTEPQCRAMTEEEIAATVARFADAARRAKAARFDAVQIHAAHGYLLSEFLSPYFNKRTDGYGGPVARRARFLLEVIAAVRREVGAGFPVLVKINAQEFLEGGFTVEDMLETAVLLEKSAVDAVEMSGGHHVDGIFGPFFPARKSKAKAEERPYYLDEARAFKKTVGLPLMLVGGIRSLDWAQRIVAEGIADYVSLSRPLIREPGLVARWRSGDPSPSPCVSDNGCFNPALKGTGIACTVVKPE